MITGLDFIQRPRNPVIICVLGTGKSGLVIDLLRQALPNGYRGRLYKAQASLP
jgi:hypothetical protein